MSRRTGGYNLKKKAGTFTGGSLISIEEIGQCRTEPENDIDLPAVFGGHISGRRSKDLKVNPLFNDGNHSNSQPGGQSQDINGNMNNVHVVTYETFPQIKGRMKQGIGEPFQSVDNGSVVKHPAAVGDQAGVDPSPAVPGSQDPQPGTFGSPYTLLSPKQGHKDSKNAKETDEVTAPNQRNSRAFEKGYGLLHGKDEGEPSQTRSIPESQQNGFHDETNSNFSENEQLILKKKKDYHLLSYENDGFVSSEHDKNKDENEIKNREKPEKSDNDGCDTSVKETADKANSKEHSLDSLESLPANAGSEPKDTKECSGDSVETAISNTIVTEAHVHTIYYDQNESKIKDESNSKPLPIHTSTLKSKLDSMCADDDQEVIEKTMYLSGEWPDMDELAKPADGVYNVIVDSSVEETVVYETEVVPEIPNYSSPEKSRSENEDTHNDNKSADDTETTDMQTETPTANNEESPVTDKQVTFSESEQTLKKVRTKSTSGESKAETSSTRTLKSILSNNGSEAQSWDDSEKGEHSRSISQDEIQECKSVKFTEDTVFHENKPRKYKIEKLERIHLRDIYRGKISNQSAATLNPLYKDGEEEQAGSMTDDEKMAYQEAVRKMMNSEHQPGSMNAPAYMEHYLILKAHGLKSSNFDIEQLPREMERPAYERLIQRTLAKERRKLIIKWTLVILTVGIITAVATVLGVYLSKR